MQVKVIVSQCVFCASFKNRAASSGYKLVKYLRKTARITLIQLLYKYTQVSGASKLLPITLDSGIAKTSDTAEIEAHEAATFTCSSYILHTSEKLIIILAYPVSYSNKNISIPRPRNHFLKLNTDFFFNFTVLHYGSTCAR
jgi:hypothetical protein